MTNPTRSVRIGVDVGGTFTKAVAFDLAVGAVVARASIATTHDAPQGPVAGVVTVLDTITREVGRERVDLVTHSTTQAVNALLEGDGATVGVVAIGRAPELRKIAKRTNLAGVEVTPGRSLASVHEVLDATNGLTDDDITGAVKRAIGSGAQVVVAAEAFAPDDSTNEGRVVEAAVRLGVPGCGSSDMTAVYGLELRTLTAALNASILPLAVRTAAAVRHGVQATGIDAPVMIMRGDGGTTDAAGFAREPLRCLYSGPAASIAGVLRFTDTDEAIVVEVGGTSTNIAAIRHGRPGLAYMEVAGRATAIRSLDVRVVGVAGGSMLRVRRGRLYGVGPRSAHIAGLPYACYLDEDDLRGAVAEVIAPRPGDEDDYVVLRLADGRRAALTNTCAAVALEVVHPTDHAASGAGHEAALQAFHAAARLTRVSAEETAHRMLVASTQAIAPIVHDLTRRYQLTAPTLVAVGGGAGAVGRFVAQALSLPCVIPDGAEMISSIGDALSLVRDTRERTVITPTAADIDALAAEAEEACAAAGASIDSIEVAVEYDRDRGTLRAVATGTVDLTTGAIPGRHPLDEAALTVRVGRLGLQHVTRTGSYWIATAGRDPSDDLGPLAIVDRYGAIVARGHGEVVERAAVAEVAAVIERATVGAGPAVTAPDIWGLAGSRAVQLTPDAAPRWLAGADPATRAVLVVVARRPPRSKRWRK